jgi:hypothetical protein
VQQVKKALTHEGMLNHENKNRPGQFVAGRLVAFASKDVASALEAKIGEQAATQLFFKLISA